MEIVWGRAKRRLGNDRSRRPNWYDLSAVSLSRSPCRTTSSALSGLQNIGVSVSTTQSLLFPLLIHVGCSGHVPIVLPYVGSHATSCSCLILSFCQDVGNGRSLIGAFSLVASLLLISSKLSQGPHYAVLRNDLPVTRIHNMMIAIALRSRTNC